MLMIEKIYVLILRKSPNQELGNNTLIKKRVLC